MILISSMFPPPADLLEQAVLTGKLEDLEEWFIAQRSPGYSFQTIADFVAERRSELQKTKVKRAPSGKSKTRKTTTKTAKAMETAPL